VDLAIVKKPLEYIGQRVITLDLIDQLHERPKGTASRNFNENRHRFVEKEDYFHLSMDEIRILNLSAKPKGLIVLTESGYLMLVKSFTDDRAWQVQKTLVKVYFRAKETNSELQAFLSELRKSTDNLTDLLLQSDRQIGLQFDKIKSTAENISADVIDIKNRLPRREFSAKTKRLFREVCLMRLGGRCLIYPKIKIVDRKGNITKDGEYDHWLNHSENGHDQGWIISKKANRTMKDNRQKYRPEFEIFQRELSSYIDQCVLKAQLENENNKRLSSIRERAAPGAQMNLF